MRCFVGKQHTVFNSQARVYVGSKRDEEGEIIRPFEGKISGKGARLYDHSKGKYQVRGRDYTTIRRENIR
jgi:hypothetical protein